MDKLEITPIEEELKRNPKLKREDIEALREWHKKQPHLPPMTDSEFAVFLHSNYYYVEPAKATIDSYYTMRTHMPEFFSNRDLTRDKGLQKIIDVVVCLPLAKRTRDGYGVIYCALNDPEPSRYNYEDATKMMMMLTDLWLWESGTSLDGVVILMNLTGLQFGHTTRVSLASSKRANLYQQEALPMRLKGMHFINTNPIMDVILGMMKPFMKKEMLDMTHLHQKPETIEDFNIPLEILPNEAGGKAGPQMKLFEEQVKKLKKHKDWFNEEEKCRRVDETKRPGKAKSAMDLFGVEGSFKKLEFD